MATNFERLNEKITTDDMATLICRVWRCQRCPLRGHRCTDKTLTDAGGCKGLVMQYLKYEAGEWIAIDPAYLKMILCRKATN